MLYKLPYNSKNMKTLLIKTVSLLTFALNWSLILTVCMIASKKKNRLNLVHTRKLAALAGTGPPRRIVEWAECTTKSKI